MTDRRTILASLLLASLAPAADVFAAPRGKPPSDADDETRGIPNLFISPCGEPFRAADGAPYPVADWFKQADANRDGKLDREEFRADAERFFKKLDLNGDGVLSRYEILVYERKWVPEILGGTVTVGLNGGARFWLAQYGGMGGGGRDAPPINPEGDKPMAKPRAPQGLNETGVGASPYSFFDEPEPIMTADLNVNGLILKDNFLRVADMHFDALDPDGRGYLTLRTLPETAIERLLDRSHGRRRN